MVFLLSSGIVDPLKRPNGSSFLNNILSLCNQFISDSFCWVPRFCNKLGSQFVFLLLFVLSSFLLHFWTT